MPGQLDYYKQGTAAALLKAQAECVFSSFLWPFSAFSLPLHARSHSSNFTAWHFDRRPLSRTPSPYLVGAACMRPTQSASYSTVPKPPMRPFCCNTTSPSAPSGVRVRIVGLPGFWCGRVCVAVCGGGGSGTRRCTGYVAAVREDGREGLMALTNTILRGRLR